MDAKKSLSKEIADGCRKALPGLLVLIAVLVLLRGVRGTVEAIQLQLATFVQSFFGGGDALLVVLLHTLPLAIAAGLATFSIARGWLTFESSQSIVALACMVLVGAWLGGLLRELAPPIQPASIASSEVAESHPSSSLSDVTPRSVVQLSPISPRSLGAALKPAAEEMSNPTTRTSVRIPLGLDNNTSTSLPAKPRRSTEIRWLAKPDLKKSPPAKIEPLEIVPETGGVLTLVARAVNQLLAYLVAYQPRLFLAAVLVGCWIGWSWHQRLERWEKKLSDIAVAAEASKAAKTAKPAAEKDAPVKTSDDLIEPKRSAA